VISDEDINRPAVVAEVRAVFECYEAALRRHDLAALDEFFLPRADTVRYGISEQNYGATAIRSYRHAAAPIARGRRIIKSMVTTYGNDVACICCEFHDPATPGLGRQMQTWIRSSTGWRVIGAHVSMSAAL